MDNELLAINGSIVSRLARRADMAIYSDEEKLYSSMCWQLNCVTLFQKMNFGNQEFVGGPIGYMFRSKETVVCHANREA